MAQHQDLKRKVGAPDHQMSRNLHAPPPLSIKVSEKRDVPYEWKPWSDVQLPVDILLLTVKDCEFLACYTFLENSFRSFHRNLGPVYFGSMGESGEEALKVALMKCYEGFSGVGGSLVTTMKAVVQLRPKAAFSVGCCMGLKPESTKLGDVVVPSKLSTEKCSLPVGSKAVTSLISIKLNGWNPPLKDPVGEETVLVHSNSHIFSGTESQFTAEFITTGQRGLSQSSDPVIAVEGEGAGKILFYI